MSLRRFGALLHAAGLIAVCQLSLPALTRAQPVWENHTFTTFAGVAEAGSGQFDGAGHNARLSAPAGVARDAAGNVFIADMNNHTIRKITPDGVVTTLAGLAGNPGSTDGLGGAARFTGPQDVAVDAAGYVFVADSYNHTIRKISPAGLVTTIAGLAGTEGDSNGIAGGARFNYPLSVEVDVAGTVFVADTYSHAIRKISPDGAVTIFAGETGVAGSADGAGNAARFRYPQDIAVDTAGTLFVADGGNHAVRRITPLGVVTTVAGLAGMPGDTDGTGSAARFNVPSGITVGAGGNLLVSDHYNQTVRQITAAGAVTTLAGKAGVTGSNDGTGSAARFNYPLGIVADGLDLLVVDAFNHTLRRIKPGAVVTTVIGLATVTGSTDARRSLARFHHPQDVAIDRDGAVYVADMANCAIRKIAGGMVTTFAGLAGTAGSVDGVGAAARFKEPIGVTVGHEGILYVADYGDHTIRKITPDGMVSTLAGSPGVSGSADGTGATARFNRPFRVTLDRAGFLYVSDSGNHLIRRITPAGLVTTLAGTAGVSGRADGVGTDASFYAPEGLAVDGNGNVFVADIGNQTIRKITPAGVVTTFAGTAGTSGNADGIGAAALFSYPVGLAVDQHDNLYVTETGNHAIRKITPAGKVTTLAGTPGQPGSTDGAGRAAQFASPSGVAVDHEGNLYVADTLSQTIRKGFLPLPDSPVVDPASGRAGVTRHFDIADSTTTSWSWTLVRCPATSSTQLWSANIRNPTLTPDVDDLYLVRFQGGDSSGRTAIGTLSISGINASVLRLSINPAALPGAVDLYLDAPAGTSGRIESSPDLSSWGPVTDFSITNSVIHVHDNTAGAIQRFYRAVGP